MKVKSGQTEKYEAGNEVLKSLNFKGYIGNFLKLFDGKDLNFHIQNLK